MPHEVTEKLDSIADELSSISDNLLMIRLTMELQAGLIRREDYNKITIALADKTVARTKKIRAKIRAMNASE